MKLTIKYNADKNIQNIQILKISKYTIYYNFIIIYYNYIMIHYNH